MTGQEFKPFDEDTDSGAESSSAADEDGTQANASAHDNAAEDRSEDVNLEQALDEAQAELGRHKEAMLRMQAEMENLRKRLQRDLEKSRKFALERFMKDLLQVRDSLERGLGMADETATAESLREGQELTLKMLTKVMQDYDLEIIDPVGEPFDPELHEAVTVQPSEELDEGTVMEVLQKGFKLHDRLVRPAMVVVSRKA
ncbi:MAG: nucleotide exchange factor GrpE [Xanthomonadales bacterium]|nr:nucleotide exchange factor GrpE [Xanthomonadales bacterium]